MSNFFYRLTNIYWAAATTIVHILKNLDGYCPFFAQAKSFIFHVEPRHLVTITAIERFDPRRRHP